MKLYSEVQYWVEYTHSWLKYNIFVCLFRIQDYLDYLEIIRFQLWHSGVSSDTSYAWYPKTVKRGHSALPAWFVNSYFTRIRTVSEKFLPVSGISWDRGTDANSLEARLVQTEYNLSISRLINKTDFQTYVLDNYPRRFIFRGLKYNDIRFGPNFTPWAQFVYTNGSVFWAVYVLSLVSSFLIFVFFELAYLYACLVFVRTRVSIGGSFRSIFPVVRKFRVVYHLIKLFSFLLFPCFYTSYICLVLISVITTNLWRCFLVVYLLAARYLFRLGFWVWCSFGIPGFRFVRRIYKSVRPFIWVKSLILFGLRILVSLNTKIFRFQRDHKYINLIWYWITRSLRLLVLTSLLVKFFTYFKFPWVIFWWLMNYFVPVVVCMYYDGLVGPIWAAPVGVFALVILFPRLSACLRVPEALLLKTPGAFNEVPPLTQDDRKMISMISISFYKAMNSSVEDPLPWRMKWWELAKEVLASKYADTNETRGSGFNTRRDLGSRVREAPSSRKGKLEALLKHAQSERSRGYYIPSTLHTNPKTMTSLDRDYESIALRDINPKFRPDEFKLIQSNLTGLQYLISTKLGKFSLLSTRIIFNCSSFRIDQYAGSSNPYSSGFIFSDNLSNIYTLRNAEFHKVYQNGYFHFQAPSQSESRIAVDTRVLDMRRFLNQLVNDQASLPWDSDLPSSLSNQWVRNPSPNYTVRRSLGDSQNFFNFDSWALSNQFQLGLLSSINRSNRNTYISISAYNQFLYDIYWIFKFSTNVFLSYSFIPNFCFSSGFGLPNWLFKNLSPSLSGYPVYQDDTASLISHALVLQATSDHSSGLFYETLMRLTKFGNLSYDRYLIDQVHEECRSQTIGIDITSENTYSWHLWYWIDNLHLEKDAKQKVILNTGVAEFLYIDLELVTPDSAKDFRSLRADYATQSLYTTYFFLRSDKGVQRYQIKGKAKLGNFYRDVRNLYRHLAVIRTSDDIRLEEVPDHPESVASFESYFAKRHRLLRRVKCLYRFFPKMNPAPIIYILGWFIGGAYVYTDFYLWPFRMRTIKNTRRAWFPPKEGEELFNFWIDFAVFILYWIVSWF